MQARSSDMRWFDCCCCAVLSRSSRRSAQDNAAPPPPARSRPRARRRASRRTPKNNAEPPPAPDERPRGRATTSSFRPKSCSRTPPSRFRSTSECASSGCAVSRSTSTMRVSSSRTTRRARRRAGLRARRTRQDRDGRGGAARRAPAPRQTSNRFWSALSMEPGLRRLRHRARAPPSSRTRSSSRCGSKFRQRRHRRRARRAGRVSHASSSACCSGSRRNAACRFARSSMRRRPRAFGRTRSGSSCTSTRACTASRSRCSTQDGEAQVRASTRSHQGLAALADAFARRIADHVRARDALRSVHSRRGRAAALRPLAASGSRRCSARSASSCTLKYRDEEFRVTAERDAVLGVGARASIARVMQLIAQHRERGQAASSCSCPSALAALPGFVGELARLDDAQIGALPAGHAARSVLLARAIVAARAGRREAREAPAVARSAARRTAAGGGAAGAAPPAARVAKPPTHVVYGGLAYRVGAEGLAIGREADPQRRTDRASTGSSGVSRLHCEVVLARR